jgi:7-cyano-7-deazaguanine synthase
VLLSGGLDSAVALACAIDAGFVCHTISFDYAQRHRTELDAAARVASSMRIAPDHRRMIRIDLRAIGHSALTDDIAVPKDRHPSTHTSTDDIPITYVPARNLIFLSLAAAYAETIPCSDLFIGVNAVDYSGYPDCRAEFIRAFEHAATLGTKRGAADHRPFTVHTPLVSMSKVDIIRAGARLGVDFSLTHSCYDPRPPRGASEIPLACGHCDSCLIRAKGFADAGVPDPTRYA